MLSEVEFWTRVEKTQGCWTWQGPRSPEGYGRVGVSYAHRIAYEMTVGPIPPKYDIDHLCFNPPCVNPAHLEAVTHAENIRRGKQRHRQVLCKRGHDLDTWGRVTKDGRRDCRLCRRQRQKNPTPEQRERVRESARRYASRKWAAMTPEQRAARAAYRRVKRAERSKELGRAQVQIT